MARAKDMALNDGRANHMAFFPLQQEMLFLREL